MLDIAYAPNRNSELLTRWAARYLPDLSATPFYVRKVVPVVWQRRSLWRVAKKWQSLLKVIW